MTLRSANSKACLRVAGHCLLGLAVVLIAVARKAISLHEKAISLRPDNPFFYYNLGISYLVLGNTEKALEQKDKLLQLDPVAANRLATFIAKHQK
jgi:tetratricopeptide (TPR) repeat protein